MRTLALSAVGLCLLGCGGARPDASSPTTGAVVVANPEPSATLTESPAPAPVAAGGSAFPASPLSDLATSMQRVVVAALEGRTPPRDRIPIEPIRDPNRLVRVRTEHGRPNPRELEFIIFALKMEIVLSEPKPSSPDDFDGAIEAVAFLCRSGLKLAELRSRGSREVKPLPNWLAGVESFGRDVHTALRDGRIEQMLIGEPERAVVANDALFEMMLKDRPSPKKLGEISKLAGGARVPVGYWVDDAIFVARDRSGGIWGFQLETDDHDGQLVLDSAPLLRVEKFDAEKLRREQELVEPLPPPVPSTLPAP